MWQEAKVLRSHLLCVDIPVLARTEIWKWPTLLVVSTFVHYLLQLPTHEQSEIICFIKTIGRILVWDLACG